MKTDIEISQGTRLQPIQEIAAMAGLRDDELELYGPYKAKVNLNAIEDRRYRPPGKLILVTAMTPTPAGEGKTTTTIGLTQALCRLGKRALLALREPSLGPSFGVKGGAAGGGYSQVLPMEDINLHFTGDIHAVTAAHNLLAALVDNSIHHGNPLHFDSRRIAWRRVMDMNERALRNVVIGLGGTAHGIPRESGFDISVASEIMAILCLANDLMDLKRRLQRMVLGYSLEGEAVTAGDLGGTGALTILLKDAIKPNLVQTVENTPALIHGGPFANIAHGCSSVVATRLGMHLGDYLVTEAGFGADLGAEKFFHLKCRMSELQPSAAVIVASIRGLRLHGGVPRVLLDQPDPKAVSRGLANLEKHLENMAAFRIPVVVSINRFTSDTAEEIKLVQERLQQLGVESAVSEVWEYGGAGGMELAEKVVAACAQPSQLRFLYQPDQPLREKIEIICRQVYGAAGVALTSEAEKSLNALETAGYGSLPICMAKTQYSLSDDPALLGRPQGFVVQIREVRLSAGAGFVIPITGSVLTMPGLPRHPAAMKMDIDEQGRITGLF